ncbi:MAG: hypothetical protein PHT12_05930 [Patescibacteria group bacterium]|nr:hypothetical protein [Patescibacteria group bacterium]
MQQALEGLLWLHLPNQNLNALASHGYLAFATIFWPIYAPLAILSAEPKAKRRRWLVAITVAGAFISAYCLYLFLRYGPATYSFVHQSISYTCGNLPMTRPFFYLYGLVVTAAGLASSRRLVTIFAVAVTGAFVVTRLTFAYARLSVWCFFAAFLSVILIAAVWKKIPPPKREEHA